MAAKDHSLFLVRHAIAEDRGPAWPDDSLRPLTDQGKARMRRIVRGMAALGVDIDLILTSPFVRAADTAAILARGFDTKPDIMPCPALVPTGTPARVAEALTGQRAQRIALVGHEPNLGELAAWLIGAKTPPKFKKGGVARIDVAEWAPVKQGTLVWLATPAMLRGIK